MALTAFDSVGAALIAGLVPQPVRVGDKVGDKVGNVALLRFAEKTRLGAEGAARRR